ncbi:MAG TPA: alpha/beta fold hydrolase [Firmicutes bacterium]|nr:alpha/beta fold hydrolase [Bacillota bacterium]
MRRQIEFVNKGQRIFGILHYPEGTTAPVPGVVLFHGFTGTKVESHRLFVKMAEYLASLGLAALRFDFRGSGDSEGNFEDTTVSEEISDALVAVDVLAQQPGIDQTRIGVIGLSLGGAVAACTTRRHPMISATVLWSAVADFQETSISNNVRANAIPIVEIDGRRCYDFGGNLVGEEFFADLSLHDPPRELAQSSAKVLIIHGDQDQTVPASHSQTYLKALEQAGKAATLKIIPGASHTYTSYHHEQEVINLTGQWLQKTLGA